MAAPFRVRAIAATCLVAVGATTLRGNTTESRYCCLCPGKRYAAEGKEEEGEAHIRDNNDLQNGCGNDDRCARFDREKKCNKYEHSKCEPCNYDDLTFFILGPMREAGAIPCQRVGKCDILAGETDLETFLRGRMEEGASPGEFQDELFKALSLGLKNGAGGRDDKRWLVLVESLTPLLFRDRWKKYLKTNVATVAEKCAEADEDHTKFWVKITKQATEAWSGAKVGCAPESERQLWLATKKELGVVKQEKPKAEKPKAEEPKAEEPKAEEPKKDASEGKSDNTAVENAEINVDQTKVVEENPEDIKTEKPKAGSIIQRIKEFLLQPLKVLFGSKVKDTLLKKSNEVAGRDPGAQKAAVTKPRPLTQPRPPTDKPVKQVIPRSDIIFRTSKKKSKAPKPETLQPIEDVKIKSKASYHRMKKWFKKMVRRMS